MFAGRKHEPCCSSTTMLKAAANQKRLHQKKSCPNSSNFILGNFLTIFWEWKTEFSTNIVLGWLFGKKSEGEQPSKKCILWSGEGSWNGHNNDLTSTKLNLSDIKNTFRLSPQSWPFFILFIHMHLATYIGSWCNPPFLGNPKKDRRRENNIGCH